VRRRRFVMEVRIEEESGTGAITVRYREKCGEVTLMVTEECGLQPYELPVVRCLVSSRELIFS
jgi:hypothetical protein